MKDTLNKENVSTNGGPTTSKKKNVPWETDGSKGPNDPVNSLNVLIKIVSVVETYNKWRGGTKFNGMLSR